MLFMGGAPSLFLIPYPQTKVVQTLGRNRNAQFHFLPKIVLNPYSLLHSCNQRKGPKDQKGHLVLAYQTVQQQPLVYSQDLEVENHKQ